MRPRSPLTVVYLTVFIDLLGFGIILPALPYYATAFGATGLWLGIIGTAYSAAQFVGSPVLGRLSDRVGRRPVLLASLLGSAISFVLSGLATSLLWLVLARGLAGLFGGSIAAAQAYIADITQPAERARYMGLLGASIGLGFVMGPAIGALLSPYGFGAAAFVAAGLAAANFLFGCFTLTESLQPGRRHSANPPNLTTLRQAFGRAPLGSLLLTMFLTTFGFAGMESTYALLGQQRYGLETLGLGLIFTFVGVIIVVIQGGLISRLVTAFGEKALAITGCGLIGLALLLLPLAPNLLLSTLILGAMAAGQGLVTPSLSALLSRSAAPDQQGGTLGFGQSMAAAARAIGPLTAGWLYDLTPALPYILGGVALFAAIWLLRGIHPIAPAPTADLVRHGH